MTNAKFHSLSFSQVYMENIQLSMTKLPLHHATDVSSVSQSVMIEEKLQHSKSGTYHRNYSQISTIEQLKNGNITVITDHDTLR